MAQMVVQRVGGRPWSGEQDAFPAGVSVEDGLTEAEAVALALWRSPDFRADLADLDVARAQLVAAGLFGDPLLFLLLPIGPKQGEATLIWPLQDLWQRPRRVEAAELDVERTAEDLIRRGLDLAHEVRLACAEWSTAQDAVRWVQEQAHLQSRLVRLTQTRLDAGDVLPVDVHRAQSQLVEADHRVRETSDRLLLARRRLAESLGGDDGWAEIELGPVDELVLTATRDELISTALTSRPELRAAEIEVRAAAERLGLAEDELWNVALLIDVNEEGRSGLEAGPGLQVPLPFFSGNEASLTRAEAELERARRRYLATRHRIVQEVSAAHVVLDRARASLAARRDDMIPSLERAVSAAEVALDAGSASLADVLATKRELVEARAAAASVEGEVRRAHADLWRRVGAPYPAFEVGAGTAGVARREEPDS